MLKSMRRRVARAALSVCAGALAAGAAAAEERAAPPYWSAEGWTVEEVYADAAGWCAAHADYRGGERLVLIGAKDGWALRVSRVDWGAIEDGRRYPVFVSTDRNWTAGYRAWGYWTASGGRSGYEIHISGRALDALARGRVASVADDSGTRIAALDLAGSARAIGALRDCRAEMEGRGGFEGRPEAPAARSETSVPIETAPAAEISAIVAPTSPPPPTPGSNAPEQSGVAANEIATSGRPEPTTATAQDAAAADAPKGTERASAASARAPQSVETTSLGDRSPDERRSELEIAPRPAD